MKSTPRSGSRRSVFRASSRSAGGPQIPLPDDAHRAEAEAVDVKGAANAKAAGFSGVGHGSLSESFRVSALQGQLASGGIEDRIEATLPPVFRPKIVPRS